MIIAIYLLNSAAVHSYNSMEGNNKVLALLLRMNTI